MIGDDKRCASIYDGKRDAIVYVSTHAIEQLLEGASLVAIGRVSHHLEARLTEDDHMKSFPPRTSKPIPKPAPKPSKGKDKC